MSEDGTMDGWIGAADWQAATTGTWSSDRAANLPPFAVCQADDDENEVAAQFN